MTQDEINRMALAAGLSHYLTIRDFPKQLERFASIVAVYERERTKDLTNEELDALWYGNTKRGWRGLFRAVIAADREKNK